MTAAEARSQQARDNRTRYPLTTEAIDWAREHFPGARLIATDEGGGRGTFGPAGVAPVITQKAK